jgi:hypothetical protein
MVVVDLGFGQVKQGKKYQANEGEVVEVKKTKLWICENGKTILKKKKVFKLPYNFSCNIIVQYNRAHFLNLHILI